MKFRVFALIRRVLVQPYNVAWDSGRPEEPYSSHAVKCHTEHTRADLRVAESQLAWPALGEAYIPKSCPNDPPQSRRIDRDGVWGCENVFYDDIVKMAQGAYDVPSTQ